MKYLHAISGTILAFFVLLAVGSTDTEESIESDILGGSQPAVVTDDVQPVAVRVTASQLFADYEANEIAADEKYKGKVIVVSGTIDNIGKDILDTMYVTLDSGKPLFNVQCFFSDKHKSQLSNVAKGQQVMVKGKCDGKFGNILLRGCSFE